MLRETHDMFATCTGDRFSGASFIGGPPALYDTEWDAQRYGQGEVVRVRVTIEKVEE